MSIHVNNSERPILRDLLYEALSRAQTDLAQAKADDDFPAQTRHAAEQATIRRLLVKLGERL